MDLTSATSIREGQLYFSTPSFDVVALDCSRIVRLHYAAVGLKQDGFVCYVMIGD